MSQNNQPSREQIELRITALLLGELPEAEAEVLRYTISQDAGLQKLHDDLAAAIALVREVEKHPAPANAENAAPLKLSDDRRAKLLAHFQAPRPPASQSKPAKELFWLKPIQFKFPEARTLMLTAIILVFALFIAALAIPNFVKARSTSTANAVMNNLRQIDAAKNEWALKNQKSSEDQPTVEDLKPYLKDGKLPAALANEHYVLGKVSEPVLAEVPAGKAEKSFGGLAAKLPAANPDQVAALSVDGDLKLVNKDQIALNGMPSAVPLTVIPGEPAPATLPSPSGIFLPTAAADAASPASGEMALPRGGATGGGGETYVIKPGDTLTKIAREHGTTVKALEEANNLSSSRIMAGAKMRMPAEPADVPLATAAEPAPTVVTLAPEPAIAPPALGEIVLPKTEPVISQQVVGYVNVNTTGDAIVNTTSLATDARRGDVPALEGKPAPEVAQQTRSPVVGIASTATGSSSFGFYRQQPPEPTAAPAAAQTIREGQRLPGVAGAAFQDNFRGEHVLIDDERKRVDRSVGSGNGGGGAFAGPISNGGDSWQTPATVGFGGRFSGGGGAGGGNRGGGGGGASYGGGLAANTPVAADNPANFGLATPARVTAMPAAPAVDPATGLPMNAPESQQIAREPAVDPQTGLPVVLKKLAGSQVASGAAGQDVGDAFALNDAAANRSRVEGKPVAVTAPIGRTTGQAGGAVASANKQALGFDWYLGQLPAQDSVKSGGVQPSAANPPVNPSANGLHGFYDDNYNLAAADYSKKTSDQLLTGGLRSQSQTQMKGSAVQTVIPGYTFEQAAPASRADQGVEGRFYRVPINKLEGEKAKAPVLGDRPLDGQLFTRQSGSTPAAAPAPTKPAAPAFDADFSDNVSLSAEAPKLLDKSGAGTLTISGGNTLNFQNGRDTTVNAGNLTLNAANAYTGGASVSGGTLAVNNGNFSSYNGLSQEKSLRELSQNGAKQPGFNLDIVKKELAAKDDVNGLRYAFTTNAVVGEVNAFAGVGGLRNSTGGAQGDGGLRYSTVNPGVAALEKQYAEEGKKIQLAQEKIETLRSNLNITVDRADAVGFSSTLNTEQLQSLHSRMIQDERAYKEKSVQLEQLKSYDKNKLRDLLPHVVNDGTLNDLLGELHKSEQKLATAKADYQGEDQAANVARRQRLNETLNKQIDDRMNGILTTLQSDVDAKKVALDTLNKSVEDAKQKDMEEAGRSQPYYNAKRELEQLREQHRLVYAKIRAEQLDQEIPRTTMVQITDKAEPAKKQSLWQGLKGEYSSTARIKVENDRTDIQGFNGTPSVAAYDPHFVQTTFEIMQSAAVLGKVVDALKLDEAWSKKDGGNKLSKKETIALLKSRISLKPVQNTKLIAIEATSSDSKEAAQLANAVADAYKSYRLEARRQMTVKGIEVLQQQFLDESNRIQQLQAKIDSLGPKEEKQIDQPLPKPSPNAPVPQPEVLARENNFSTFSLNVSDVSFKLAAASLERGKLPDAASIRSEEFINAFNYRDPEAAAGQPLAFASERARYPFAHNRDLLRFSVKTAAAGRAADRPLNLVLLLDTSGSMERADRVAIIREALRVLASQLQPQDTVSVVTFARTPRLWADGVSGDKAGEALEQVGGITPEGGTNLEEAMRLAYATARRHYLANGMNRVVLLTDGAANLGNVDPAVLKQEVEAQRRQGIALDCFGIGWEDYDDTMLEELSGNGDGRYAFINSPEDAAKDFASKLAGALQVAAQDVKVQVEFNPQRVVSWRQIGYAKHQLTKEQFRDNSVIAAEIAAQEAGNALYAVETRPDGVGPVATVYVRYRVPGTQDVRERSWAVDYAGEAPALVDASPAMRLAATASAFSEWLAASPFAQEVTLDDLSKLLSGVPEIYGADERPKQLETMLREARSAAGQ